MAFLQIGKGGGGGWGDGGGTAGSDASKDPGLPSDHLPSGLDPVQSSSVVSKKRSRSGRNQGASEPTADSDLKTKKTRRAGEQKATASRPGSGISKPEATIDGSDAGVKKKKRRKKTAAVQ